MKTKEAVFRVASLALVGIGFIAGVAGADKDGADHTVAALEDLIYDIKRIEEVNKINSGQIGETWKQGDKKVDDYETVPSGQVVPSKSLQNKRVYLR